MEQFTKKEIALIGARVDVPSLDDEIWMQRMLNRRLMNEANAKDKRGHGPTADVLIRLAKAMTLSSGRVARLLRDKTLLTGDVDDVLQEAITYGLDQLELTLGHKL